MKSSSISFLIKILKLFAFLFSKNNITFFIVKIKSDLFYFVGTTQMELISYIDYGVYSSKYE